MNTTYRDVERPEGWSTKDDVARWIAQQAGVPVDEVRAARKKADKARGHEWRSDDELGRVRRRVIARLNAGITTTPTRSTTSTARRVVTDPAAARAARMTGPISDV